MSNGETYALTGCCFDRLGYCDLHGDYRDRSRYSGPCESGRAARLEAVADD